MQLFEAPCPAAALAHPRQGKRGKEVEVRAVRIGDANVLDQRHRRQHVAAGFAPAGAAPGGRQRRGRPVPEQEDGRHPKAPIDGARHVGEPRAGVAPARLLRLEVDRDEQK